MSELTSLDMKLITALTKDGRASVTTLAGSLNVSRATVQHRMERLISSGIIRRFTIDVDARGAVDVVRAVMMVEVEGVLSRSVSKALQQLPEIVSLYTTNGNWDFVAQIETANLAEFDLVLRRVREIKGVLNSETSILLNRAES